MTTYELWQLNNYGNVIPEGEINEEENYEEPKEEIEMEEQTDD